MTSSMPTLLVIALLSVTGSAQVAVQIVSPVNGATVQGQVIVAGTTTGLSPTGRVAVSIAGGPFQLAGGTASWTFAWDTTTVPDGGVLVRVRARETIFSTPSFAVVNVIVSNAVPSGPTVTFLQPSDGATVLETLTVIGSSTNATIVELAVDGGPFQPVQGLDPWNAVFGPGSLTPGAHVFTARASDTVTSSTATLNVVVGTPPAGRQTFTYVSSVDGEAMTSELWLPQGFDPSNGPRPLFVYLHGAGGTGSILPNNATITAELDVRDWIGIAPDGREWGLADIGCAWNNSPAYVDSPDPDVGPGEQDIFDAIDWAVANLPIDTDRIYLSGFSYGGRGSFIIGLKNPDRFAAIAPLGSPVDMYEIYERRTTNTICREGIAGGEPFDSAMVDTFYTITSGRFLLENAYNLPVWVGHGLNDTVASNTTVESPFLHGFHVTTDTSWSGCHGTTMLCFGHTPTLSELAASHPMGYPWAYMFTPVGHVADARWFTGTAAAAGLLGTPDPASPGDLIGVFDFLASRSRVTSPDTVVYKTYTDTHERAYWVELSSSVPWTDVPAAVRASRDTTANHIDCEIVRAAAVRFDLGLAGLSLTSAGPLTIDLAELVESVFDPALLAPGETLSPSIVLDLGAPAPSDVLVLRDGVPLLPGDVSVAGDEVTIVPVAITGPTTLSVFACSGYFSEYGHGFAGSGGITPRLVGGGCPSPGQTFTTEIVDGLGSAAAVLLVGTQPEAIPLVTGGDLLVGPVDQLAVAGLTLDGSGSLLLTAPLPPGLPAFSFTMQAVVVDGGSPSGYALTNGLRVQVD